MSLTPVVLRLPRSWRARRLLVEWAVWRGIAARKRGDLEVLRTIWHPDCIFDFTRARAWVGGRLYRGHDGLAELAAEWGEAWREGGWVDAHSPQEVSLEEFDHGVFLFDMQQRGVGRISGAPVEMGMPHVIEFRDGLPWRFEHFNDAEEAIEAARARSSAKK
jgi:hypothetical protein